MVDGQVDRDGSVGRVSPGWLRPTLSSWLKNGEAPPEGRREGGAKPPKKATEMESKRGGSDATVQRTKSCDMIVTNQLRSIL